MGISVLPHFGGISEITDPKYQNQPLAFGSRAIVKYRVSREKIKKSPFV